LFYGYIDELLLLVLCLVWYAEHVDPDDDAGDIDEAPNFWDAHEMSQDNAGSPYLYDADDEITHRADDVPNPAQWEPRENPNSDLIDAPNQADNVTDVDWLD
jgi:hypothetical protein